MTRRAVLTLSLLAALAWVVAPVWLAHTPPLLDYHNHLARQYILARIANSPHLANWYVVSWHASPYLAFDGIVQALATFMPVAVAGKAFLSLMLLLLGGAPLALNFALFGRVTPVALLGLLFVHNQTVTLGFANYLFGVGFALCAAAAWIQWRGTSPLIRLLLFPLLSSLVFFSHLLGFALYTLVVGSYEFGRWVGDARLRDGRWRLGADHKLNLASIALQCALPLGLFAAFGPSTEAVASNTYGGLERKLGLLWGIFDYLMPPYLWSLDRVLWTALPVGMLILLITRHLRMDPGMRWPLLALLALYLAMPMELFGVWGTDHRLLPVLGLLFVGSVGTSEATSPRALRAAFALVLLLVAVRVAAVGHEWRKSDDTYAEYLRAFQSVPHGSRIYFAFGHTGGKRISTQPVYHLPTLALSVSDVYVPYLFASASGSFTLQYRQDVEHRQRLSRGPVLLNRASPDWAAIIDEYDYFLLVDEQHFEVPAPATLQPVFEGRSVRLYQRPLKSLVAPPPHINNESPPEG